MFKLALLVPVVFALNGAGAVAVEGSSPVSLGKKGTAYPVKCGEPIKLTATGPATLIVDVRGQADVLGKPVEVDVTRNEKFVSKNALTIKKGKEKRYAGIGRVVISVPEGAQQYALSCDATSDLAMSFQLTKKAAKGNPAAAEIAVVPTKPEAPKVAVTAKPGEPPKAVAGNASGAAYVGLFSPTTF